MTYFSAVQFVGEGMVARQTRMKHPKAGMKHPSPGMKHPNIPTRKTHGGRSRRGARAGEKIGSGPGASCGRRAARGSRLEVYYPYLIFITLI